MPELAKILKTLQHIEKMLEQLTKQTKPSEISPIVANGDTNDLIKENQKVSEVDTRFA